MFRTLSAASSARAGRRNTFRALFAAAALTLAAACSPGGAPGEGAAVEVNPYLEDVGLGDAAAPVELLEYASTTCTHCRDFWKQVFPVIRERYIDTGKARFILRDFPTAPPQVAAAGVAIARCAGEAKYYDVMDALFDSQYDILVAAQSAGGAVNHLMRIGVAHGLTEDEVRSCIRDERILEFIAKTQREAPAEVRGTPTLFVNGAVTPDHSIEGLSSAIDAALAAGAPAGPGAVAPGAPPAGSQ